MAVTTLRRSHGVYQVYCPAGDEPWILDSIGRSCRLQMFWLIAEDVSNETRTRSIEGWWICSSRML